MTFGAHYALVVLAAHPHLPAISIHFAIAMRGEFELKTDAALDVAIDMVSSGQSSIEISGSRDRFHVLIYGPRVSALNCRLRT